MGRRREIDPERILDAAELVVARDGAARLTLDAVAEQAGISKGSVLYSYNSKRALIEAVVRRAVQRDNTVNASATKALGDLENAGIRGRIVAAAAPFPDEFRAVALNLVAALAQDEQLRAIVQNNQAATIQRIVEGSPNPRGALLAYLALEGLKFLESLDYYRWTPEERSRILEEITGLVDIQPVLTEPSPRTAPGLDPEG